MKYTGQLILQLEDEGTLRKRLIFDGESKNYYRYTLTLERLHSSSTGYSSSYTIPDKISNLQSRLCVFQSEVMAMKSFILEQFLLTKEQQMNFQLPVKLMVNL